MLSVSVLEKCSVDCVSCLCVSCLSEYFQPFLNEKRNIPLSAAMRKRGSIEVITVHKDRNSEQCETPFNTVTSISISNDFFCGCFKWPCLNEY